MIDLSAIDPARGDRYSPNLHRWHRAKDPREDVRHGGVYPATSPPGFFGRSYIGYRFDGDLIGARLFAVLGKPTERLWSLSFDTNEDDGFFERYYAIGRCAMDPNHDIDFQSREDRFDTVGPMRTCRWCGVVQRRETYTIERTRWVLEPNIDTIERTRMAIPITDYRNGVKPIQVHHRFETFLRQDNDDANAFLQRVAAALDAYSADGFRVQTVNSVEHARLSLRSDRCAAHPGSGVSAMPAVSPWLKVSSDVLDDREIWARWEDTAGRPLVAVCIKRQEGRPWYWENPHGKETANRDTGLAPTRPLAQLRADARRPRPCGTCDHACPLFKGAGATACALAPDHDTPHDSGAGVSWDNAETGARAVDYRNGILHRPAAVRG